MEEAFAAVESSSSDAEATASFSASDGVFGAGIEDAVPESSASGSGGSASNVEAAVEPIKRGLFSILSRRSFPTTVVLGGFSFEFGRCC